MNNQVPDLLFRRANCRGPIHEFQLSILTAFPLFSSGFFARNQAQ
jgi:hypothetical protein